MNKKIFLWVNYYKELKYVGTTNKIKSQIKTLRDLGYDVCYSAYTKTGVAIYDNNDNIVLFNKINIKIPFLKKVFLRSRLLSISMKYVDKKKFDFFILRINLISRKYIKLLKIMRKKKSIVMIETLSYYPYMTISELRQMGFFLIYKSIYYNRKKLRDLVDLALTEGNIKDFFGINTVELGMGVDLEGISEHCYSGDKETVNLIMIGCDAIYHGTDRIIKSLHEYYKSNFQKMKIYLHLVGSVLEKDKKMISKLNLDNYIFLHGKIYGNELERVYNQSNIALGPLAQFRTGKKDTGLKTKEYFAKGIPYIYSGEENTILDDYPYILKIENDESVINLSCVIDFYNSLKSKETVSTEMRNFARNHYSWEQIYKKIFKYVEQNNLNKTHNEEE